MTASGCDELRRDLLDPLTKTPSLRALEAYM